MCVFVLFFSHQQDWPDVLHVLYRFFLTNYKCGRLFLCVFDTKLVVPINYGMNESLQVARICTNDCLSTKFDLLGEYTT